VPTGTGNDFLKIFGRENKARFTDLEALSQADSGELSGLGLETNLGKLAEDGVDVSRGQWQKIAIARAFLSQAEFVVLDEPTASLDPIAESKVYQSFGEVLQKKGAIVISHRLASARMAERILLLEGGEVAESGSHEELMASGGLYATMYEEQSSWYKTDT
jgi:ABC-type multidrug transport system fused ATPase/permease subunit